MKEVVKGNSSELVAEEDIDNDSSVLIDDDSNACRWRILFSWVVVNVGVYIAPYTVIEGGKDDDSEELIVDADIEGD